MALGFSTEARSSGDILPIIKFDAKGGDWIKQDRVQGADGTWQKNEEDISPGFKFAADLDNMEVGWLSFASGAPDFHMVRIGDAMVAKPSEEHKQAFRMRIVISGESGPGNLVTAPRRFCGWSTNCTTSLWPSVAPMRARYR